MFHWLLLAMAVGGIAALARGRGGSPTFYGIATVVAFEGGAIAGQFFGRESVLNLLLPWAFVGFVALHVRFILGAGRPKPYSMWSCPDCNMVNESNYVVCQACQRPWTPVVLLLAIGLAASAHAELIGLSYHDMLNSDVVVLGRIENVHRVIKGDVEMNTGTIRVERVFAGKADETVDVFWTNRVNLASRISHERYTDLDTLWFLKRTAGGPYDANNIQRALPLARDNIRNFVEFFEKRHGPPDTPAETAIYKWIREQDARMQ